MKIICLVKFTPDVDAFEYDYENNVLIRENVKQIINPDDACALGLALELKKQVPELVIDVVTMGPLSVRGLMEDVLRRNIDHGIILSDVKFRGSDTLATSLIIGSYLQKVDYDAIFTGSHSLDGDTSHVPSQVAEFLGLDQMSYITKVDKTSFLRKQPRVEVDTEKYLDTYEMPLPSILSLSRESKIRLPFVRFADLDLDVSDRIQIIDNEFLKIDENKIGLKGSATKVVKTYTKEYEKKERILVKNDNTGIEKVYDFLKEEGYIL
ncbi:MAG: electron transfer flavoprotein subunit beta/FixA family protein [Eubacteriaceae bacterium]